MSAKVDKLKAKLNEKLDSTKDKLSQLGNNVSSAETKAKGELNQKIANAKAGFAGKQEEARTAKDRLRTKLDQHKAEHDAKKAAAHAEDAAEYAAYCIDYSAIAINEAEYAVLKAVDAQITADELNG
jgi:hypothetical protein